MNSFLIDAFQGYGVPAEDAAICATCCWRATAAASRATAATALSPSTSTASWTAFRTLPKIDILKETATTAVLDAGDGMGMVASHKAMEMAIEKAKKYGLAMVVIRNSTHYGIAGYWATMATKAGMIGRPHQRPPLHRADVRRGEHAGHQPPHRGLPHRRGVPFHAGLRHLHHPARQDEYYARVGKDTPAGMVIGHDGKAMTDSPQILKDLTSGNAALAPLGGIGEDLAGYKGYGYATVVEVLSAALQAGNFLKALTGVPDGKKVPYHLGHWFLVIDPEAFMGLESFKKTCGDILRELRASQKAPGEERIYTAGEKEYLVWLERKDKGVPVSEPVQKEILAVRDKLGLPYKFPFEK
jgi:LDH2 family malate/lactate/ureidoglycolate dehydrogenase